MSVKAVRVSKTSIKGWVLYGPVDGALNTTCQADAVKPISLKLDNVHGETVEVELWINTAPLTELDGSQELNPPAQVILQQNQLRTHPDEPDNTPLVLGVAVLTGPGATDFPQDKDFKCIISGLLGLECDEDDDDLDN